MPGGIGVDDERIARLHRVVAFDALLGVVAGLAFLDDDRGAADAAVPLVEHRQIVAQAVEDGDPRPGIGAGAVAEKRNEISLRRLCRRDRGRRRHHHCQAESKMLHTHGHSSLVRAGSPPTAHRPRSRRRERRYTPGPSAGVGIPGGVCPISKERATPSTFCLPICQSRARPLGSRIRKTMINTPTITKVSCSAAAGRIGSPNAWGMARSAIGRM